MAEQWRQLPLVSQEQLDIGLTGGEGCQWLQALSFDETDGRYALAGTDVGGIFRSIDGGYTWAPANTGLNTRGCSDFAFDPMNPERVIMVAGNSMENTMHGLYQSLDGGATWQSILAKSNLGYRDFRKQVKYDPASYSPEKGYCELVYWSSQQSNAEGGKLFRSSDGGSTWEVANEGMGDCILGVHPTKGYVYAGARDGFYVSRDNGETFENAIPDVRVTSVCVVKNQPDRLFVMVNGAIYESVDGGYTFDMLNIKSAPPALPSNGSNDSMEGWWQLSVSPMNPENMVMTAKLAQYDWACYYSVDGGLNWARSNIDKTHFYMPVNGRQSVFAWHPTKENTLLNLLGDAVIRSDDAGATFEYSNTGNASVMLGSSYQFNPYNPDVLLLSSQDYAASVTLNGGSVFKYLDVQKYGWGGFCYGGYAASPDVMYTGGRKLNWNSDLFLYVSRNGGAEFIETNIILKGKAVSFGDPTYQNILFASEYRSTDQAQTWTKMDGCDGVLTAKPDGSLIGMYKNQIVLSDDHGASWEQLTTVPSTIADIAFDSSRDRYYVVTGDFRVLRYDAATSGIADMTSLFPVDQYGARPIRSIAVDPVKNDVVYAVYDANVYMSDIGVARSVNGGRSFHVLTRGRSDSRVREGLEGPREASWVRVNPVTREVIVGTCCYGMWRIYSPDGFIANDRCSVFAYIDGDSLKLSWNIAGECEILRRLDGQSEYVSVARAEGEWYDLAWTSGTNVSYIIMDADGNNAECSLKFN